MVVEHLSAITKSKLRSKQGFSKAEEESDPIWLLAQLEDIMVRFEEVKPKVLAIDDQMQRIMNLKQGDATNEDFVKLLIKELKVYEKHGGDFLWGEAQKIRMEKDLADVMEKYKAEYKDDMPDEQQKEQSRIIRKKLREEIMAIAILKRADKRRFGNLLIHMKNNYLMGNDLYPSSVADVLRVLDHFVNGVTVFPTISRRIDYRTVSLRYKYCPSCSRCIESTTREVSELLRYMRTKNLRK